MDNFRNDEESKKKLIKKQRAAFLVSLITLLSISFCASYFITDYITNPNRKNANIDEENENVYADNKYLSDNIFITLKTQDNVDTIDKLANIIKKFKKSIALFRRNWYYIHVLDSGIAQLVVAHDC